MGSFWEDVSCYRWGGTNRSMVGGVNARYICISGHEPLGGWEKLQGGWVGVCPWVALCQDKQENFQETPTSSLLLDDR